MPLVPTCTTCCLLGCCRLAFERHSIQGHGPWIASLSQYQESPLQPPPRALRQWTGLEQTAAHDVSKYRCMYIYYGYFPQRHGVGGVRGVEYEGCCIELFVFCISAGTALAASQEGQALRNVGLACLMMIRVRTR